MTIIIRTFMNVLPEKQKEVLQTLLSLIEPPENEEGCLSYDIFGNIEDKNSFGLISEWQNRLQLNRHLLSDRFSVLLGTRSLLENQLRFQIITVSAKEGMEVIDAVRKKEHAPCRFIREGD